MALTELAAKQAKPKEKDYKLSDEKGLFLLIKKTGAKYWRLKYRHPHTRKERLLSLGVYPEVGLKQARKQREAARDLLSQSIDPSDHKKATKAAKGEAAAKKQLSILDNDLISEGERTDKHTLKPICISHEEIYAAFLKTPTYNCQTAPKHIPDNFQTISRQQCHTRKHVKPLDHKGWSEPQLRAKKTAV